MSSENYADYQEWKGWADKPFGVCPPELAVYFSKELKQSGVDCLQGKRVLEIGFGNGEFARWARDAGADYHGTELIGELIVQGTDANFSMHNGRQPIDMLFGKQSFDIIQCTSSNWTTNSACPVRG